MSIILFIRRMNYPLCLCVEQKLCQTTFRRNHTSCCANLCQKWIKIPLFVQHLILYAKTYACIAKCSNDKCEFKTKDQEDQHRFTILYVEICIFGQRMCWHLQFFEIVKSHWGLQCTTTEYKRSFFGPDSNIPPETEPF